MMLIYLHLVMMGKHNEVGDREEFKGYINQLREMMKPEAELSAVVRDCVLSDSETYIKKIASRL